MDARTWYTDERTESYTDELMRKAKPGVRRPVTKLPYGALVSGGQETWIARDGHDRTRSITGIDIKTGFPSKAVRSGLEACGRPRPHRRSETLGEQLRHTDPLHDRQ
jgi:hypothetical protein